MSRYVVQAKTYSGAPLYFYVHDSLDSAPETIARGTKTYPTEAEAVEVAERLNAEPAAQRSGRNGLTTY
jgi:hypothetical protein